MLVQNLVLFACVPECKNNSYHVYLSYLSIAVINTMTKTTREGHSPSPGEVSAWMKAKPVRDFYLLAHSQTHHTSFSHNEDHLPRIVAVHSGVSCII